MPEVNISSKQPSVQLLKLIIPLQLEAFGFIDAFQSLTSKLLSNVSLFHVYIKNPRVTQRSTSDKLVQREREGKLDSGRRTKVDPFEISFRARTNHAVYTRAP